MDTDNHHNYKPNASLVQTIIIQAMQLVYDLNQLLYTPLEGRLKLCPTLYNHED
jgi:hypothetical protein